MTSDQVSEVLERGVSSGCTEALFTFGQLEHNITDYVVELCQMAIEHGLLPHTNAGVISYVDLKKLKPLNASMGLMLETTANVRAHCDSPDKVPELRLNVIEDAGRLKMPFTTGILVGIGETWNDRIDSLLAIKELHVKYGHIQEVIIQSFMPKPNTPMANCLPPTVHEMQQTIALARRILPSEIAIQVPVNLMSPLLSVPYGASDLGGISTETVDYINPERKWPAINELGSMGLPLKERLPIYPHFVIDGWYSSKIEGLIERYADENGFRKG
jgi:FO synthase subunit 1